MESRNEILAELNELSPFLADQIRTNVFNVPDGYFDYVGGNILDRISEDYFEQQSGISKNISFEIPVDYFETLPNEILNKIKTEQAVDDNELREVSPMLYAVQGENVFNIPSEYFNSFADTVLNKIHPQSVKVVSFYKRTSIFKYAVAAIITGVMALGVYQFIFKVNHTTSQFASLAPFIQKGIKMNQTQFDTTLNNLSDDAIASYLEKNGNFNDVAALSSSLDVNNLPSTDDYLLDDKTLDNYFNDNSSKQIIN